MSDELLKQKIEMWQKKLTDLEKQYEETMTARGEAASEGDLRENAAYEALTEQGEVLSARISETKTIIKELEEEINGHSVKAA